MTRRRFLIQRRAQLHLRAARAWWKRNRDKAPSAFDDDIDEALELIRRQPFSGVEGRDLRGRAVRRLFVERIRYYIYYRVIDTVIEVLAIWHAARRPPKL